MAPKVTEEWIRGLTRLVEDEQPVPQPALADVLYTGAGQPRNCRTCAFWSKDRKCAIHDGGLDIAPDMICGYHVPGFPRHDRLRLEGLEPVDQRNSGLTVVQGGASCNRCSWFQPDTDRAGNCVATEENGKPSRVEPMGCCSRWLIKS